MPFFKSSKGKRRSSMEKLDAFQSSYDHGSQETLTALHSICKNRGVKVSSVKEIVRFHPGLIDATTSRGGDTPLHYAAANGDKKVIKYLLKKGPHVAKMRTTECSDFGYCVTPLHVAVANQASFEIIFSIVQACPESVSVEDGNGNSPYVSAAERYTDNKVLAILAPACSSAAEKKEQLERLGSSTDISVDMSLSMSADGSLDDDVVFMY